MTALLPSVSAAVVPAERCLPLERLAAWRPRLGWDVLLLAVIVVIGTLLRFVALGDRAMHHDESLHATFSWYFFKGEGFEHDPLMHGPLLFHLMAFGYLLLGVSDATARVVPALFGSVAIALPWLLRGVIGRIGALTAALLIAVSPTMLYFSRFVGAGAQDILLAVTSLLIVAAIVRYLQDGQMRWLVLVSASLSLSFATKEVTFMLALIFLMWLNGAFAAGLVFVSPTDTGDGASDAAPPRASGWWFAVRRGLRFGALLPVAWAVAALWPLLRRGRPLPRTGDLLLVLGLFTAPQCAAALQIPLARLGYDLAQPIGFAGASREAVIGGVAVGVLIAATTVVGVAWRRRTFGVCAAVFWGIYVLLFTTFFTNLHGFATGIWGSLDYWIAQHGEERGRQPVYYYAMLTPLYEYLTVVLAVGGVAVSAWHGRVFGKGAAGAWIARLGLCAALLLIGGGVLIGEGAVRGLPFALGAIALLPLALWRDSFRSLVGFWLAAIAFGLSVAGEKMPWLEVHIAVPLALLAAVTVADALAAARRSIGRPQRARALVTAALAAGVAGACAAVVLLWPGGVSDRAIVVLWLCIAALAVCIGVGRSRAAVGIGAVALVMGLMLPLTVRDSLRAAFVNGDTPNELLVYTQTSPQLKARAGEINRLAAESGLGRRLPITVDTGEAFTWPWAWYLRDYSDVQYVDLAKLQREPERATAIRPAAVLITMYVNADAYTLWPNLYGTGERLPHRWWFPEEYRGYTLNRFRQDITSRRALSAWANYFLERDVRSRIGAIDTVIYQATDPTALAK